MDEKLYKTITEGKAKIKVPKERKISSDLPVFYNPVMKLNRDMSILLLKVLGDEGMQILDPLAGSGVRSIRFLLEVPFETIRNITINDKDKESVKLLKENICLNKLSAEEERGGLIIENRDANALMLESKGFDYIDIDPFGTPNPFLDMACRRIARQGILAVTATDTSALSGTYIKACKRKYWAEPRRDHLMHETGLRILIRKCQLIGAQYEKALVPVFSYSKDHYMRVFFRSEKGKKKVDEVMKQHGMIEERGPLWLGKLWDKELVDKMYGESRRMEDIDKGFCTGFLELIKEESKMDSLGVVGFHDVHAICKKIKKSCPRFDDIIGALKKKGERCSRTHFSKYGIKTEMEEKEFKEMLEQMSKRR